ADKPDWGRQIELTLEAEEGHGKSVLNISFDSAYGRGFMYSIPGVDLDFPVEIEPYNYFSKKKGREMTGLSIIQHGEQLPWVYTKDNPNGMPQLKQTTFKGKTAWDNTDQLRFLDEKFQEFRGRFNGGTQAEAPEQEPELEDTGEQIGRAHV